MASEKGYYCGIVFFTLAPIFVEYQNFVGSLGRYFVGNGLLHYVQSILFYSREVESANIGPPGTMMIPQYITRVFES